MLSFQKKVSFDSINPNKDYSPDDPPFIPPQYIRNNIRPGSGQDSAPNANRHVTDLDFGFAPMKCTTDVEKVFESFNFLGTGNTYMGGSVGGGSMGLKNSGQTDPFHYSYYGAKNTYGRKRKAPKLPPPPERTILKKHVQKAADGHMLSPGSGLGSGSGSGLGSAARGAAGTRKKSIVDMTPEELLALDRQYRKGVDIREFKFEGDGYLPFLQEFNAIDTRRSKKIKNIDKAVSSFLKSTKNTMNDVNFKSFSNHYIHAEFKQFVKEKTGGAAPKSDSSPCPDARDGRESLRTVMIYISGRKHTWDAINWSFKNYLKDGDHLVISCRVPARETDYFHSATSVNSNTATSPAMAIPILGAGLLPGAGILQGDAHKNGLGLGLGLGLGNGNGNGNGNVSPPVSSSCHNFWDTDDEMEMFEIKRSVENLRKYVFKTIELLHLQNLKISVSIEFVKEPSLKNLLRHVIALYQPHVVILSSLLSSLTLNAARINYRLPVYIMRNLHIPTIVIPDLLIDQATVSITVSENGSAENENENENESESENKKGTAPFLEKTMSAVSATTMVTSHTDSTTTNSGSYPVSIVVEDFDTALLSPLQDVSQSCQPAVSIAHVIDRGGIPDSDPDSDPAASASAQELSLKTGVPTAVFGAKAGGDSNNFTVCGNKACAPFGITSSNNSFNSEVFFLNRLNGISDGISRDDEYHPAEVQPGAPRPYKVRDEPQVLSGSCASSVRSLDFSDTKTSAKSSSAVGSDYFSAATPGYKLGNTGPSIKFCENLKVPRSSATSGTNSQQVSRRSSALSNSVYKVKSLLDDDCAEGATPSPRFERTKSMSSSLSQSFSLEIERRRSSSGAAARDSNKEMSTLKKVFTGGNMSINSGRSGRNKVKEKKSGFFGFFKKKK